MHAVLLATVILIAIAIIGIGCFYIGSPAGIAGSFGLKPAALDANTQAWLRLKGIRDVASGLVVLALAVASDGRSVGLAVLALAFIPFGDMMNILLSRGRTVTALSVHGVTCMVMLILGASLAFRF